MISQTDGTTDVLTGEFDRVSSDPRDVIPSADVVLVVAPVFVYDEVVENTVRYLSRDKDVYYGFLYGQGGINWKLNSAFQRYNLPNAHFWSFGLIPWISRVKKYGESGVNYGAKHRNVVFASSDKCYEVLSKGFFKELTENYFGFGCVHRAERFVELTLSVDNQIIHPSRCYGLSRSSPAGWNVASDVPMFYRDFDETSADTLIGLDGEFELVREEVRKAIPMCELRYMQSYLDLERFSYDSESGDVRSSFTESGTLSNIGTPVREFDCKFVLDARHRFFWDDTFYGLDIMQDFAQRFGISTPLTSDISRWCREQMASQGLDYSHMAARVEYRKLLSTAQLLE
ncbi:NAD/NADP octopine/nopaline dehydrogenase family protein [Sulfitobacter sp. SBS6]|uniref:NAD/NADP octopine/nopaline dehydrogenase family protein n=1 Tax=Sulfitobacter sp. SBS6 TaxID=3401755 RepID=UPI003AAFA7EC